MRGLELLEVRHFGWEIMVLCVHWYLKYKLSSRDLAAMMAERGIALAAHDDSALCTTLVPWVRGTLQLVLPASP